MLAKGIDPAAKKRRDKHIAKMNAANTFGSIAKAYIERNRRDGLAEATVSKREWFLRLVERRSATARQRDCTVRDTGGGTAL